MLSLSALVLTLLPLTNGLSVGGGSTQAITAHPSAHTTHAAARHAAATHALGRRALLASALSGAAALSTAAARADMDDLSAPEDLSAPGPAPVMISTYAPGEKREEKKRDGPYQRIKELQAKGGLTDKEKKELKRLKAEEMCEMLGRGC